MELLIGVVVVLALVEGYFLLRSRSRPALPVPSEIRPARDLQEQYGLYAENRPLIRLDPQKVPPGLRDLVPVAETWGIGDDVIRFDFEQKATEAEKAALLAALSGRTDEIQAWLRGQSVGGTLCEEAEAFMYLLTAWDEVRPVEPEQPGPDPRKRK